MSRERKKNTGNPIFHQTLHLAFPVGFCWHESSKSTNRCGLGLVFRLPKVAGKSFPIKGPLGLVYLPTFTINFSQMYKVGPY